MREKHSEDEKGPVPERGAVAVYAGEEKAEKRDGKDDKKERMRGTAVEEECLWFRQDSVREHVQIGEGPEKGAPEGGSWSCLPSSDCFADSRTERDLRDGVHLDGRMQ